jgi:hypothetical protein
MIRPVCLSLCLVTTLLAAPAPLPRPPKLRPVTSTDLCDILWETKFGNHGTFWCKLEDDASWKCWTPNAQAHDWEGRWTLADGVLTLWEYHASSLRQGTPGHPTVYRVKLDPTPVKGEKRLKDVWYSGTLNGAGFTFRLARAEVIPAFFY